MTQLDTKHRNTTDDFSYVAAEGPAGLPARVAIFADNDGTREGFAEDLEGAGFRTIGGGPVKNLLDGPIALLGDVVMVDCPVLGGDTLAALVRLDMRVAQAGAKLIVTTSIDALDAVFAALDQSDPQILVQPSRADRILAVGRVLADIGSARVREMTDDDRLSLLHLSRQVEAIATKLQGLTGASKDSHAPLREHAGPNGTAHLSMGPSGQGDPQRYNSNPLPLPEPGLVRRIIATRQARSKFFEGELFADPAWDMLLDLTAAKAERNQVLVTSLCIAAEVPATTALRWIKQLVETGIFVRVADPSDRRRAFIALSEQSSQAMARYFAEVEMPLLQQAA
ncbi:MAG: MarR family transcriptional regulator [Pseudomonadota bacterium]